MAIPKEMRRAAVEAYQRGEGSIRKLAQELGIGTATLQRWLRRVRQGEDLTPRHGGGHRPLLSEAERRMLVQWVTEDPQTTVEEVQQKLAQVTGRDLSQQTVARYLRAAGLSRRRPKVTQKASDPSRGVPGRERTEHYKMSQVQGDSTARYPGTLTDAEWARIAPIFERDKGRGRPEIYSRRSLVDAMCYVVRSGCSWRMLPKDLPPWTTVYRTFQRWSLQGRFEAMHDHLRRQWREREGRAAEPTGAIVDSQSVKTTEKGGPEGTTAPRNSMAGNDIS